MRLIKKRGLGGETEGQRRDGDENAKQEGEQEGEYEERYISMGAKNTANMQPGERIIVLTPGGGGYGKVGQKKQVALKEDFERNWKKGSLAGRLAEWESSS